MVIRPRVLIIDEDRRTVDRLQEMFAQVGFEAEVALSPDVGIAIVSERIMAAAVLSAKMGNSQDWHLVRELKKSDPKLPVILFNAPKVKGMYKEARQAGCTRFIGEDGDTDKILSETVKLMRN